jgi:hypothetical protein
LFLEIFTPPPDLADHSYAHGARMGLTNPHTYQFLPALTTVSAVRHYHLSTTAQLGQQWGVPLPCRVTFSDCSTWDRVHTDPFVLRFQENSFVSSRLIVCPEIVSKRLFPSHMIQGLVPNHGFLRFPHFLSCGPGKCFYAKARPN